MEPGGQELGTGQGGRTEEGRVRLAPVQGAWMLSLPEALESCPHRGSGAAGGPLPPPGPLEATPLMPPRLTGSEDLASP